MQKMIDKIRQLTKQKNYVQAMELTEKVLSGSEDTQMSGQPAEVVFEKGKEADAI